MSDVGTAYTILRSVLSTLTGAIWAGRAYADQVPVMQQNNIVRPYVVYAYAAGGDQNAIIQPDPNLVFTVKCVGDDLADALTGDEQIRIALDDHGAIDRVRDIVGDTVYIIKTITRERHIHYVENVKGAVQIYHAGAYYRLMMEKR